MLHKQRYRILNDGSAYASPLRLPPCDWKSWREYVERLSSSSSVFPGQRDVVAYATCHTYVDLTNACGGATYNRTFEATYMKTFPPYPSRLFSISCYVLFVIYNVLRSIFLAAAVG